MRGRCTERALGQVLCRMGETDQWWGVRIWGSAWLETPMAASCRANRVCKEVWGASRGRR